MLLFKPHHMKPLILAGIKTEPRRIWKKRRAVPGSIHQARTELFGKPFAHLRILEVYREPLREMTEEFCRAEGGYTKEEFISVWKEIDGSWDPDATPFVVKFEVVLRSGGGGPLPS